MLLRVVKRIAAVLELLGIPLRTIVSRMKTRQVSMERIRMIGRLDASCDVAVELVAAMMVQCLMKRLLAVFPSVWECPVPKRLEKSVMKISSAFPSFASRTAGSRPLSTAFARAILKLGLDVQMDWFVLLLRTHSTLFNLRLLVIYRLVRLVATRRILVCLETAASRLASAAVLQSQIIHVETRSVAYLPTEKLYARRLPLRNLVKSGTPALSILIARRKRVPLKTPHPMHPDFAPATLTPVRVAREIMNASHLGISDQQLVPL